MKIINSTFTFFIIFSILVLGLFPLNNAFAAVFVDSFDISGQEDFPTGLAFSADGTKMFVVGTLNAGVNEYALGIAFDISSIPSTSTSQAVGQTTILGTCGLSFPDGNSVDYGALLPNTISNEITLNMTNSGSISALLEIRGTDWKDGSNNSIMNVNQTHFNQTSNQNTFAQKALLNSTDGIVTNSFVPSEIVQLFLQLEAILLDPFFTGSATQTMDFTVSC